MFSIFMFLVMLITIGAFIGFDILTHFSSFINFVGAVALGVGVYLTFKPEKKSRLVLDLEDNEENQLLKNSYQKALTDYNYLKGSIRYINDIELKNQLMEMQRISANILRYLQKHPEKISLARRFIDYYQDTTAGLIEKYIEIEHTQLNTDNILEIKQRTKNTIMSLKNAYVEQFEKLLNDQLINMDAELKVMENTIKADGFERKNDDIKNDINAQRIYRREDFSSETKLEDLYEKFKSVPLKMSFNSDEIWKRKLVAGGLGILFGGFGAHKFYLGQTLWGILYLVFSWTGIPFIVGFVEGVRYIFMNKEDFYDKFLDRG